MQLTQRILKHKTKPVEFRYPTQNQQLAHDLLKAMRRERGCGLAANQVGIKLSAFVMLADEQEWVFFNPRVVSVSSETELISEGCLSFPDEYCEIVRPTQITLHWQTYLGDHQEATFTGIAARIVQHELDHLQGITMYDRITINQHRKEAV